MPVSRRYHPEWSPGDQGSIGMDFSALIPPGVGITFGALFILTTTDADASTDFTAANYVPAVGVDVGYFKTAIADRIVYVPDLKGGIEPKDYQFQWEVTTSAGDLISRAVMLLCADTS
jgi:hypothetical protein